MTTFVEEEALNKLLKDMLQFEGANVSLMPVHHFPGWYEVTVSHPQADKGSAVDDLCQSFNSKWKKVVVFGDEVNDLPLFERADYSIAVANAAPQVLTKANEVILSNDSGLGGRLFGPVLQPPSQPLTPLHPLTDNLGEKAVPSVGHYAFFFLLVVVLAGMSEPIAK